MNNKSEMGNQSIKLILDHSRRFEKPQPIVTPDGTVVGYLTIYDDLYDKPVSAVGDDPEIQKLLDVWYEQRLSLEREKYKKRQRQIEENEKRKLEGSLRRARAALGLQLIT